MEMRPPFDGLPPPPTGGAFELQLPSDSVGLPQLPTASLGEQSSDEGGEVTPDMTAPTDRGVPEPAIEREVPAPMAAEVTPQPTDHTEATEVAATPSHPVVETLDRINAQEILGDPERREELRREIDTDTALSHLNHANGLIRGIPPEENEMDGTGGIVTQDYREKTIYDPPAPEERVGLLKEAIEASKTLDTEHGATLTGLAINATHVWQDGNGGLARVAYAAETHGYDGSEADRELYNQLLVKTEGRKVLDLSQAKGQIRESYAERSRQAIAENQGYEGPMPTSTIGGFDTIIPDNNSPGNLAVDPDISTFDRIPLFKVVTDPFFGANALTKFVLENRRGDLDRYIDEGWEGQPAAIDLDSLLPELSGDDINTITQMHADIKRGYVRDLIDTFTNPDRRDEAQALVDLYRPAWRR